MFDRKRAVRGELGRITSMEVAMRPPAVFVRALSPEEGARLKSISRKAKYQSKRQRAIILLASSTGISAPQIAAMARTDESHVRKVGGCPRILCTARLSAHERKSFRMSSGARVGLT